MLGQLEINHNDNVVVSFHIWDTLFTYKKATNNVHMFTVSFKRYGQCEDN